MVATDKEPLAMLSASRSAVIVNTHEEMPPRFIRDPDMEYPAARLLDELRQHSRPDGLATLDATRLASALLGDSIAANVFMLGFAFQKGLIPLSSQALYRALELFGRNVKMNKRTFDWGRYTAAEPAQVLKLAYGSETSRAPDTLPELVQRRSRFLVDYQNEAYAARFRALVDRVAAAERGVVPASSRLALAAARSYFKLLAYKDEYEVARLHTSGEFLPDLRRNFGQGFKLKFHFSPPLFARIDPETGRPKKYEYGGWMLPVLRMLARLKFLRGTPFDIFGRSRERRVERQLIADYEQLVAEVLLDLCPEKLDQAVEILALAESIKGYGLIKDRSIERYARELKQLRTRWNQSMPAEAAALPAAAAAAV
jgi:indolepyruvate ferredoxin oxidoreductase